jgi:hypothetical protein
MDGSWELARLPGSRSCQHTRGWDFQLVYSFEKNKWVIILGVANVENGNFSVINFR